MKKILYPVIALLIGASAYAQQLMPNVRDLKEYMLGEVSLIRGHAIFYYDLNKDGIIDKESWHKIVFDGNTPFSDIPNYFIFRSKDGTKVDSTWVDDDFDGIVDRTLFPKETSSKKSLEGTF